MIYFVIKKRPILILDKYLSETEFFKMFDDVINSIFVFHNTWLECDPMLPDCTLLRFRQTFYRDFSRKFIRS